MTAFEVLLDVQAHDTALDQLRHELAALPERTALADLETQLAEVGSRLASTRAERDAVLADEKRLDDEASTIEAKAAAAEQKLYSGSVTSPKELEAMQADVDALRRHRSEIEDRELEVMEQREAGDAAVAAVESQQAALEAQRLEVQTRLDALASELNGRIAAEQAARDALAAGADTALLGEYERRRAQARGVGIARLVGATCQGCHLSIPSTEVEVIRHAPDGEIHACDNCGCILVVST